ncbi:MAG: hypothetical protein ACREQR_06080 [Candidatus Binataceae bacterium]
MKIRPHTIEASTPQTSEMPKSMRTLVDFAGAIMIDLPFAAAKRVLARTDERELNEAGWKAYDAIVKVANDATSRVYTNSFFGRAAAGAMEAAVRAQRLNVALSGAIFANLWPAIGLPTAVEVALTRSEIETLRNELAEARVARAVGAPAEVHGPRDSQRLEVETSMIATARGFERPIFAAQPMPEGREVEANVGN